MNWTLVCIIFHGISAISVKNTTREVSNSGAKDYKKANVVTSKILQSHSKKR